MTFSDGYYLALETEEYRRTRDPFGGGHGRAWSLDNPAGFRAYMNMTRYSPQHTIHVLTDIDGRPRWVNDKGWRIYAMALLHIQSNTQTSLSAMADRIGCCRMTVSRWITKLTAWGLIGSHVLRGRRGGLVLFGVIRHFTEKARAKLAAIRARKLNAHPPTQKGHKADTATHYYSMSKGVHLNLIDVLGLDNGRSYGMVQCPAHEDRQKSLSWRVLPDGKLLLHCFAGCTFDDIRKAAGA